MEQYELSAASWTNLPLDRLQLQERIKSYIGNHISSFLGLGGREGAVQRCPNCRGTGMQVRVQQLGPGMMQQIQSVCHECQGQGERIDPKHRCKTCNGRKVYNANYRNA